MRVCFRKKVANWQGLVFLEWFEAQESRKVCVEQLEKQAAGLTARGCRAGEDVKSRLGKGTLAVPKEKDVLLLGSTVPRQEVLHVKLLSCTSCSP